MTICPPDPATDADDDDDSAPDLATDDDDDDDLPPDPATDADDDDELPPDLATDDDDAYFFSGLRPAPNTRTKTFEIPACQPTFVKQNRSRLLLLADGCRLRIFFSRLRPPPFEIPACK